MGVERCAPPWRRRCSRVREGASGRLSRSPTQPRLGKPRRSSSASRARDGGLRRQPPCSSACRYSVPRHARCAWCAPESAPTSPVGRVVLRDRRVPVRRRRRCAGAAQFSPARIAPPGELSLTVESRGRCRCGRVYDAKDRITQCSRSCTVGCPGSYVRRRRSRRRLENAGWTGACNGLDECVLDFRGTRPCPRRSIRSASNLAVRRQDVPTLEACASVHRRSTTTAPSPGT